MSTRPSNGVILVELLVTAGLLVLLGATASLVIRRELRPLESMATAADDIARGDLERRVDESDPSTEIGRLGVAFNDMLDGISTLLDERRRSEHRLRQFVADASHELRTPVAAVRGYTDLYNAGALPDDAAVERAMQRMGFEARRMGALVDDLLTLIQADAERTMTHERVDLAGPADRRGRRRGRHRPDPDLAAGRRLRAGGRARRPAAVAPAVRQSAGQRPHPHPDRAPRPPSRCCPGWTRSRSASATTGRACPTRHCSGCSIGSTGWMPSRSRENGGTGLGLSIVAAIVRSHGGQILASHTPGGGLTMTVVLPRGHRNGRCSAAGGSRTDCGADRRPAVGRNESCTAPTEGPPQGPATDRDPADPPRDLPEI